MRFTSTGAAAHEFIGGQGDAQPNCRVEDGDLLLRWNAPAGFPSLDGSVTVVPEGSGQLSQAAEAADDKVGGFHVLNVRLHRTAVNLENVQLNGPLPVRMDRQPIGPQLRELRDRSGLSIRELATAMGYKNGSSIQHMFKDEYREGRALDLDVAKKLVTAMVGRGNPPIMPDDIFALAGFAAAPGAGISEGSTIAIDRENTHGLKSIPRDIPVYGTAIGGPLELSQSNGSTGGFVAIEQTSLDRSEVIDYLRRTPALADKRDVYGVFITGSSMAPKFEEGDMAIVDPHYPAKIGDDVIVQLRGVDHAEGDERIVCVLIKRLVRRSASYLELEQFNPPLTFRIEMANVRHIHRVMPIADIMLR